MNNFVVKNIRLEELVLVANKNRLFYDEFETFIKSLGYKNVFKFINENNENILKNNIEQYFNYNFKNRMFDGIARPYTESKSKWYLITWLLRDAPQQRIQPLLKYMKGETLLSKKVNIIFTLIIECRKIFTHEKNWEWYTFNEIMIQRLEGSRRSLKGSIIESILRVKLKELFKKNNINLDISEKQVSLFNETYDIKISNKNKSILIPVKSRETMGGGHAALFTRDIDKAISVANNNGSQCIPIIIAESWNYSLKNLKCEKYIHLKINPNQIELVNEMLDEELKKLIKYFKLL